MVSGTDDQLARRRVSRTFAGYEPATEKKLTLTTEELAARWGVHPESLKRAVRNGMAPVRPIIPGSGRWVFSLAAIEEAERATLAN